jgi:sugar/nucleoside kinase (ribokinase family)
VNFDCISAGILVADHLCSPIPRLPEPGELILCDDLPLSIGGCAANVAIDLTRLGVHVAVCGCVGHDTLGQFIIDHLHQQGVNTSAIHRVDSHGTSGSLILNVQGQDRRFITSMGANAAFEPPQIPRWIVLGARVFYIGGYLFTPRLETPELVELFREARLAGVKTVLDVVVTGRDDHWSRLAPLLAETDVFLPNEHESALITGLSDPVAQAERFLEAGARTVVITRGEQGAILMTDRLRLRAGVFPTEYVGGTGSGDAFDAGYILGLIRHADQRECLRWGAAIGASCVRSVSATDGVFTRKEAEEFLRTHELVIEDF